MGLPAKRYAARAPRYIIRSHDKPSVIVSSKQRRRGQFFKLNIVDLSETGMSFVVDWHFLPKIDEILRLDFELPDGGTKLGALGRVVRLQGSRERAQEAHHFSGIKVAIEFMDSSKDFRQKIRLSIDKGIAQPALELMVYEQKSRTMNSVFQSWGPWIFGTLVLLVWFIGFEPIVKFLGLHPE